MKAKTKKYKYMHTLDGKPARYNREQVCFVTTYWPGVLVDNLKTVREQQLKSAVWRSNNKYPHLYDYGHIRVYV